MITWRVKEVCDALEACNNIGRSRLYRFASPLQYRRPVKSNFDSKIFPKIFVAELGELMKSVGAVFRTIKTNLKMHFKRSVENPSFKFNSEKIHLTTITSFQFTNATAVGFPPPRWWPLPRRRAPRWRPRSSSSSLRWAARPRVPSGSAPGWRGTSRGSGSRPGGMSAQSGRETRKGRIRSGRSGSQETVSGKMCLYKLI